MQFLLHQLTRAITAKPGVVLAICAFLGVLSLPLVPYLKMQTSRDAMASKDSPFRRSYEAFLNDFGGLGNLIVVAQGEPEKLLPFAQALDAKLQGGQHVGGIFYRVDVDAYAERGLLYLSKESVAQVVQQAQVHHRTLIALFQVTGLTSLLDQIVATFKEAMRDKGTSADDAGKGLKVLADLFTYMSGHLEGRETVPLLEKLSTRMEDAASPGFYHDGTMRSTDARMLFVFLKARLPSDSLDVVFPFYEEVKGTIAQVQAEVPGVTAGLTGVPANIYEEMSVLTSDLYRATLLAIFGVALLFALAFRSAFKTMVAIIPLLVAALWTAAWAQIIVGHLNVLTSSLFAILVGLGIDFSIHLIARYDEAKGLGLPPEEAVRSCLELTGRGVALGALTSALAFFTLAFTEYGAFSELGMIASVGLLFALLAALLIVPSILLIRDRRTQGPARVTGLQRMADEDRMGWLAVVQRRPWVVVTLGLAITAVLFWRLEQVPFDYNVLNLLPSDAESGRLLEEMTERSSLAPDFNAVVAETMEEALRLSRAFRAKENVSRVESIFTVFPEEQTEKLAMIASIRGLFEELRPEAMPPLEAVDLGGLRAAVSRFIDQIDDMQEMALSAGMASVVGELEGLRGTAEGLQGALGSEDPQMAARAQRLQDAVFDGRKDMVRMVRANLDRTVPLALNDIPEDLRARFIAQDGRLAVYVFPKRTIWDHAFLAKFEEDCRAVSDKLVGFATNHWHYSTVIRKDFGLASVGAALAIVLCLLLDFRSIKFALLAVIPLAMGATWMLGMMNIFGLKYNFANLVALPLIIGIGVDSGVHIVHRFRHEASGRVDAVVRHTGMAVALSSATTMVSFGSMAIARHRGVSSLGVILFIGVGACLISSIFVLPAVLEMVTRRMNKGEGLEGQRGAQGEAKNP